MPVRGFDSLCHTTSPARSARVPHLPSLAAVGRSGSECAAADPRGTLIGAAPVSRVRAAARHRGVRSEIHDHPQPNLSGQWSRPRDLSDRGVGAPSSMRAPISAATPPIGECQMSKSKCSNPNVKKVVNWLKADLWLLIGHWPLVIQLLFGLCDLSFWLRRRAFAPEGAIGTTSVGTKRRDFPGGSILFV